MQEPIDIFCGTVQGVLGGSVDMKDAGGDLWRVGLSSGLYRKTPIVVTAGKTTRFHAGVPFVAELELFNLEKNK